MVYFMKVTLSEYLIITYLSLFKQPILVINFLLDYYTGPKIGKLYKILLLLGSLCEQLNYCLTRYWITVFCEI